MSATIRDTSGSELERLFHQIQLQLSPDADVRFDEMLPSKAGKPRQCDITVRARIPYEILVVIECKDYSRPVSVSAIDAFHTVIRSVGAHHGIMVSRSGYTSGAKEQAAHLGVELMNLVAAQKSDWTAIIQPNCWLQYLKIFIKEATFLGQGANGINYLAVPTVMVNAYSADGVETMTFEELLLREFPGDQFGDIVRVEMRPTDGHRITVTSDGEEVDLITIWANATLEIRRYLLRHEFGGGTTVHNESTGQIMFRQLHTEGIDWRATIASQQGEVISPDEANAIAQSGALRIDMRGVKRFIRFEVTQKGPVDVKPVP